MTAVPPASLTTVTVIGNPNTGKSTLFNALTGLRQKVGNYAGVTVEKHEGRFLLGGNKARLVDLPGTYSLAAQSPDEMVAVDVLIGEEAGEAVAPDAVLVIVDASNLRRNLFLASQILDLGLPTVIALNMMDQATRRGIVIDVPGLESALGVPVVPVVASRLQGIAEIEHALLRVLHSTTAPRPLIDPHAERQAAAYQLRQDCAQHGSQPHLYHIERALIDNGGYAEQRLIQRFGPWFAARLTELRQQISQKDSLAAAEARRRYQWINGILAQVEQRADLAPPWSHRVDRLVSHPLWGSLLFLVVMAVVFQAVFAWAQPAMDFIEASTAGLTASVNNYLPPGALSSLISEGMLAGVGSVLAFLPQILLLSLFIILLEDSGYMARAAFLMDRLMRFSGLSGQSFIPMLSSFACAVPGILATRVIPDDRDRLATILAAPFMTCSARLPIYALLIAAFVPQRAYAFGMLNQQGLVLFGLYLIGIIGGIGTALLIKRAVLRGPAPVLLMELPPYRLPSPKAVALKLTERVQSFLGRAGSIIFTVSVVVWALAYFPRPDSVAAAFQRERQLLAAEFTNDTLSQQRLADLDHRQTARYLEQSALGRIGHWVEPAFRPLGWDWKVSAAVLASFPAREVVIAVLGTIYAVGADVDEKSAGLIDRIRAASWPDGKKVFSFPVALGLMVFYAFCLQCGATVAIIRRETNSWRWAGFAWVYMTTLGYLGAMTCVYLTS